jgi:hypothetical protein
VYLPTSAAAVCAYFLQGISMQQWWQSFGLVVLTLGSVANSVAAERLLTVGGGYSPSGNQVSLEKNVHYYQRMLPRMGLDRRPHHVLFADGNDPAPDLQVRDPQDAASATVHDLAAILGHEDGLDERYRTHALTAVDGPATTTALDAWFTAQRDWQPGERLLFYYTGHGGGGDKKTPRNTNLRLWDGEVFSVTDLVTRLDRMPTEVPVVLVMVQCHSGGFADVLFAKGDATAELADQPRCGFFSTVPERVAAGCTADIDEEDYQEYSTYFWAALSGETRLGKTIVRPDYDGDGRVSLAEAHAYVIITSPTIDIPIKTSDVFLRRFSQLDDDSHAAYRLDQPFSHLRDGADHITRAVLDGLSRELGLTGDERLVSARAREQSLVEQRKEFDKRLGEARKERDAQRKTLAKALKARWPELSNPYHPRVHELLNDAQDPIGTFLDTQASLEKFHQALERLGALEDQKLELERQQAKVLRFLRAAENVVLAGNLPLLSDAALLTRFTALLALEGSVVGSDG